MYSGFRWLLIVAVAGAIHAESLRVCADPNNLPYSNARQQGFENELAHLIAGDLGRTLTYNWAPQRGRYLRNGLEAGLCDLIMGVTTGMDEVLTTRPYYRSSYAFVTRVGHAPRIKSFDDPALRHSHIGIHVLQHEDASAPPAQVLITRGLASNIVWYKLYPDFQRENPPAALMEAVERGDVDVAVVWGPLAGYFAKHARVPLNVVPAQNQTELSIPLAFNISMGVRRGDTKLLAQLNSTIDRLHPEIRRLLQRYGVPLVGGAEAQTAFVRR